VSLTLFSRPQKRFEAVLQFAAEAHGKGRYEETMKDLNASVERYEKQGMTEEAREAREVRSTLAFLP
jgi:hypothetical protein